MITLEQCQEIAAKWAEFMGMDIPYKVEMGPIGVVREQQDRWGIIAEWPAPPKASWVIRIPAKTPIEKMERVVLRELIDVFLEAHPDSKTDVPFDRALDLCTSLMGQLYERTQAPMPPITEEAAQRALYAWYGVDTTEGLRVHFPSDDLSRMGAALGTLGKGQSKGVLH